MSGVATILSVIPKGTTVDASDVDKCKVTMVLKIVTGQPIKVGWSDMPDLAICFANNDFYIDMVKSIMLPDKMDETTVIFLPEILSSVENEESRFGVFEYLVMNCLDTICNGQLEATICDRFSNRSFKEKIHNMLLEHNCRMVLALNAKLAKYNR